MKWLYAILLFICFYPTFAQDTVAIKNNHLPLKSIAWQPCHPKKEIKSMLKIPKHKQGFFCNFEDQLNRKKIPLDFSLGKNIY